MSNYNFITPLVAVGKAPEGGTVDIDMRRLTQAQRDAKRAVALAALRADRITHVLDTRGETRLGEIGDDAAYYVGTDIIYHQIPMEDHGQPQPAAAYMQGVMIIRGAVLRNERILVHCRAGASRSVSMVYAWLRAGGMQPDEAWGLIHASRPEADRQYFASADAAVPAIPSTQEVFQDVASGAMEKALLYGGGALVAYGLYKLFFAGPEEDSEKPLRARRA